MPAVLFRDNERGYFKWLKDHPTGFVLTTGRSIEPGYMSVHRARCRMISKYMKNMKRGAFTERAYIKICAGRLEELSDWIQRHEGSGFTKRCSICNPFGSESIREVDAQEIFDALDKQVRSARRNAIARRRRLRTAPTTPEKIMATTTLFKRNPDVIAEVLERARGRCEKCRKPAPFKRAKDQEPYLEVHHDVPLAKGGVDSVENARALCPNCHRRAHFG